MNSEKQNSKEAELMAKLEGKDLENIVQIYEASKNSVKVKKKPVYSIIMEYLDGEKLTSVIKSGLSDDKVLEYSVQIFNGIKSLREHGIFHRDLRPDNIMIMRDYIVKKSWKDMDNYGNFKIKKKDLLKIIDFGSATDKPGAKPKPPRGPPALGGQDRVRPGSPPSAADDLGAAVVGHPGGRASRRRARRERQRDPESRGRKLRAGPIRC